VHPHKMIKMLLPTHTHGGRWLCPQFLGLGLFRGLNQANNCIFGGYIVIMICFQDIFRGIAKYSNFLCFRLFLATGLWRKCG
jgi:hypothetical protein